MLKPWGFYSYCRSNWVKAFDLSKEIGGIEMKFIRKHQRVAMFLLLIIAIANLSMIVFVTGESEGSSSGRLTDGSFENLKQFTNTYNQFSPSKDSP